MNETNDELNLSHKSDMMVWAFSKPDSSEDIKRLYEEIKKGRSRFGWSSADNNNLNLENNWTDEHSKQLFLLEIKKGRLDCAYQRARMGKVCCRSSN